MTNLVAGREKQLVGMVKQDLQPRYVSIAFSHTQVLPQEDKVFRNIHVLMVDDGPTQARHSSV